MGGWMDASADRMPRNRCHTPTPPTSPWQVNVVTGRFLTRNNEPLNWPFPLIGIRWPRNHRENYRRSKLPKEIV